MSILQPGAGPLSRWERDRVRGVPSPDKSRPSPQPSPYGGGGAAGFPGQASRRGRARTKEPCLRDILLGTGAFLLVAAACLYLVAQLAS
jgi:hypothetical protein